MDWRGGVARDVAALARRLNVTIDAEAFADAWRGKYQPSMEEVRSGRRVWTILDVLHRESLVALLPQYGLAGKLSEPEIDDLNQAWHRLDPWPDTVPGLARLKKKYIIAPHSNGNIALMVNMARRGGIPWDTILGAEVVRNYKPVPQSYVDCARVLGLVPSQVMMVACHNSDLKAASAQGLRTGFVSRPQEKGPGASANFKPDGDWDIIANSFVELAERLGA